jgi:tetratricopeptide (TPR) repeat protein
MIGKLRFRVAISLGLGMALLPQPAQSQKPGAGGAGGAAGGTTTGRTTPATAPNPNSATTLPPDMSNRGLFLSGKVQLDDGTAPPESVVIERNCNGYARAEGYTDFKGNFSFQLGQNATVTQDASVDDSVSTGISQNGGIRRSTNPASPASSNTSRRSSIPQDLSGCEIRAVLAGFRSDVVNLSGRRLLDSPDVGTIVLHRRTNVEGTTISATTLMAPKDARKAYDKAREAARKGKTNDAERELDKAVAAYPQFAEAWSSLGVIHEEHQELADARRCFSQALAADPKLVTPYLHLARFSAADKNWPDVAATTNRLIKLNPYDFPEAYFYNAVAAYNLRKYDVAHTSALEAQKLDMAHKFPKVEHLLGVILYQKKDYPGAIEQMRKYLLLSPDSPDVSQVKQQLADLEKAAGGATKAKADQPPE